MEKKYFARQRPRERGQTIILVAISLVSLLAMAALAIDIVTLYVARSELQRATDAAALAGAKAIADSGLTSLQSADTNYGTAGTLAQTMADRAINAMIFTSGVNLVGGQLPVMPGSPTFDLGVTHPGSYQVTVSLTSATLPTFFSKIWSRSGSIVAATATAEAYNPANLTTPITPIALKSVKPWLVANVDPNKPGTQFINNTTGVVEQGVTGETLNLTADCQPSGVGCTLLSLTSPPGFGPNNSAGYPQVEYVPALVNTNPANVCPTSAASCSSSCLGASSYELSIECADVNPYTSLSCGNGSGNATWDNTINPEFGGTASPSATGADCLIHAPGAGINLEQDTLTNPGWPSNPMKITGGSCSVASGQVVTTSSSIVTIPIIDTSMTTFPASGQPLTVVGFMQAFINQVQDGSTSGTTPGDINVTILNIAGCSSSNNGANPVVGGSGTSPIPVRLITSP